MSRLTILVLVGRGDEHGDTLLEILLRDVSERLALRVEVPVRIYRPDDSASFMIQYLDLYDLVRRLCRDLDVLTEIYRRFIVEAIKSLTITNLTTAVPSLAGRSARVSIHDTPIIDRGTPTKSLIRRRVLIESYTTRSQDIVLANVSGSESSNISIPEHVGDVTVSILPTTNRTVQTIRADGRVVRHNPTGLSVQKHHISSSRHPLNISIVSTGNTSGKLLIAWQTADTTLAWVEVRVGE
ncbi:DUF7263 family protein [Haloquadratum walsbyi]|uniref:DUF7263 family protein n=1 Tax=Haloquadratum walsbyi TaxID=293091 RepID=UPI000B2CD951|nr:hypothetical protein [Haloquadratum walsbyi]